MYLKFCIKQMFKNEIIIWSFHQFNVIFIYFIFFSLDHFQTWNQNFRNFSIINQRSDQKVFYVKLIANCYKNKKKFNQSNQTDEEKVTLKIKTFSSIWCDAFDCSDALLSSTLGRPARGQVPLAWTDDYLESQLLHHSWENPSLTRSSWGRRTSFLKGARYSDQISRPACAYIISSATTQW